MLSKRVKQKLGVVKKTELLLKLLNDPGSLSEEYKQLSAPQMQELRSFLEKQVMHFSALKDAEPLTLEAIKNRLEPIPNYYHNQDCREPLEACFNETCLASYPTCFKNKMNGQLSVILGLLENYLHPAEQQ